MCGDKLRDLFIYIFHLSMRLVNVLIIYCFGKRIIIVLIKSCLWLIELLGLKALYTIRMSRVKKCT